MEAKARYSDSAEDEREMERYVHKRQHLGKKRIYVLQDHRPDNLSDQEDNQQKYNDKLFDQIYVWVED